MKTFMIIDTLGIMIATFLTIFFGCTEIVDIDLNSADPKIVIEGSYTYNENITGANNIATVRISKTIDFFNSKKSPKISNADVKISDSKGNVKTLQEVSPGLYEANIVSADFGEIYTINVTAEDNLYSAKSMLSKPLPLDSISHEAITIDGNKGDRIHYYFQDTPNKNDYAQAKIFVNGKQILLDNFELYYDIFSDGVYIDAAIEFANDTTIVSGDTVEVELITFDEAAYHYYFSLNELVNINAEETNFGTTIPDNPPTNLTNDALGFFGVYSISRKSIVIK